MADFLFANNVSTTLNGAVGTGDTTWTVADGSILPTPIAGKTLRATAIKTSDGTVEIVDITAISTNDLTVTRAREGTTALAFADGDTVELRITKEMLESFQLYQEITIPLSSETADAAAATAVTSWFPEYDYKLHSIAVVASVAPTGSTAEFDMNDEGVSMLSTVVSIDAGEDTSDTAATPPVISDTTITAGNKYTFDIDQVGATIAGKGYKARLVVSRT
jgi:hypothetical protein